MNAKLDFNMQTISNTNKHTKSSIENELKQERE